MIFLQYHIAHNCVDVDAQHLLCFTFLNLGPRLRSFQIEKKKTFNPVFRSSDGGA